MGLSLERRRRVVNAVGPWGSGSGSTRLDQTGRSAPLDLTSTAALVGAYRWIEHTLYEVLGTWVVDIPLPGVQIHVDAQSTRHAWHAELWALRLPVLHGSDPDALTVSPDPAGAVLAVLGGFAPPVGAVTSWAGLTGDDDTADGTRSPSSGPGVLPRLAGLYRVVLPRLITSYGRHLRAASAVSDGPLIRALQLVLADEIEDWHAGERLVQRLVARPHDVVAVSAFQQRLEAIVVTAGISSGLLAFPDGVPLD